MKETDPDKAKRIAEKTAWRKAMDQSKGVKASLLFHPQNGTPIEIAVYEIVLFPRGNLCSFLVVTIFL